ncbi:MAG: hypothetical protein AB7W59_00355 [Acidimicrobiia bacterium]
MRGYTRDQMVHADDARVFEAASLIVATFPDMDKAARSIRCHEVARAVHALLTAAPHLPYRGEVHDGVMNAVEHSWLLLLGPDGRGRAILDTYTMARLPPVQLVLPWMGAERLYTSRGHSHDDRPGVVAELVATFRARVEQASFTRRAWLDA